ncbi:MAG: FtsQ-type POTRA domain-containing protein [Proteobacteria bacterium]|nr:FtsQ-type POTRA domain-containing protein [Pseudomonadota bacterium]
MARKRVRKNYYKNSLAKRTGRIIGRCVLSVKILLLMTGIGGTSLLFILAHDVLTQSSYFEARTITVEGNDRLSTEAILKQGKIKPHDNILEVNLRVLRDRLLANPWIAAVEVERELPDTIHIRVRERVPIAMVELNRPYYLSETGEIFKHVAPSDQTRAPVVTGLSLSDIDPSNPGRFPLFRAVMEVLHLSRLHGSILPPHGLQRIHADPEMGLTLFGFENNMAVKFGFGGYESKFNRLRDMISYLRRGGQLLNVGSMDLNDLDRVVIRPSRGVSLLGVCYRKET